MTFNAQSAVYPMRLTGVAGGETALELFVVADRRAMCPMPAVEFCDRFGRINRDPKFHDDNYETRTSYRGTETGTEIAHPAVVPLMWDGCVLTKFAGTIPAADMTGDIQFTWRPFEPLRQHFFTVDGAWHSAIHRFLAAVGAWGMISMVLFRKRIRRPRGVYWYFGIALLPVVAILAGAAAVAYDRAPKLDASEVHVSLMARPPNPF